MSGRIGSRWAVSALGGILAVVAIGVGCASSLKPKAASTLKCPEAQLVVQPDNTYYVDVVTGCGRSDVLVLEGGKWSSLRERAIFELTCANEQIEITVINPTLYGVTGCGNKAVYKYVHGAGIVANTTQGDGAGGPTAH